MKRHIAMLTAALAWGAAGCGGSSSPGADAEQDAAGSAGGWQVELSELPGTLYSVWGTSSDDVWAVGAAGRIFHRDAQGWQSQNAPTGNVALWWVTGTPGGALWASGAQGVVLHAPKAGDPWEVVETNTQATFYGIWAAPDADVAYAAGGFLPPDDPAPPVLLRIEGGAAAPVADLPQGMPDGEAFFKVWGTAHDDVWVIGFRGSVLHFDGTQWTLDVVPGPTRLVTIAGASPDDAVIVGGANQGLILEWDPATSSWVDRSPEALPGLNGVFVRSGVGAVAGGNSNTVLRRAGGPGTAWEDMGEVPGVSVDWHGVWVDPGGGIWLAGGDLFKATKGTLAHWAPPAAAP